MGIHTTLTRCIGTHFFSFSCLFHNGIRRTVKGTGWKNRTSLRAQDFSGSGLAEPLTVTEYGVTFADRKEKNYLFSNAFSFSAKFSNSSSLIGITV